MTKKKVIKKPKKKEASLTLVRNGSPIKKEQLLMVLQKTPKEHIYTRPGKGGGTWEYVTGTYVKKVLNYVFGWMWDFEVKEHGREGDLIWVLGRLTIKARSGKTIVIKEQFGRAEVKVKRGTKIALDFGNDLKAATTDALKKCAAELGIASDIYGSNEFKEIQKTEDKKYAPPQNGNVVEIENKTEIRDKKVVELKARAKGRNDKEKAAYISKVTTFKIDERFNISQGVATMALARLLDAESKK